MVFWMLAWKSVLLVALAVFTGLTLIVTAGGALDIRRLFQRLRDTPPSDD